MENDAAMAIETALATLSELMERKRDLHANGACHALADKAMTAESAGPRAMRRAGHLGS